MTNLLENYLTVDDVQKLTNKTYQDVLGWFKHGLILSPPQKIGTAYIVPRQLFFEWAETNNIEIVKENPKAETAIAE